MGGLIRRENWILPLPGNVQGAIRERMSMIRLEKGQTLNEAGDVPTGLYELEGGYLKLCRLRPDGGLRFLALYASGSTFGETAVVAGRQRHQHSSVALAPSRVRALAAPDFYELSIAHPEIAGALCRKFANLVGDLLEQEDSTATMRLRSRIVAMLLSLAGDLGDAEQNGRVKFTLPISHSDIAQHVDATRQAVQRELAKLARARLIERSGSLWVLPDSARLRTL